MAQRSLEGSVQLVSCISRRIDAWNPALTQLARRTAVMQGTSVRIPGARSLHEVNGNID